MVSFARLRALSGSSFRNLTRYSIMPGSLQSGDWLCGFPKNPRLQTEQMEGAHGELNSHSEMPQEGRSTVCLLVDASVYL